MRKLPSRRRPSSPGFAPAASASGEDERVEHARAGGVAGERRRDDAVDEEDAVDEAERRSAEQRSRRGGRGARPGRTSRPRAPRGTRRRSAGSCRWRSPRRPCAGASVPVSTAAARARTDAVRIGKAPTMTDEDRGDEEREEVPRRRAEALGHGREPDPERRAATTAPAGEAARRRASHVGAHGGRPLPAHAPLRGARARPWIAPSSADDVLPGERVLAREARVAPGPAGDRAGDRACPVVERLALQAR